MFLHSAAQENRFNSYDSIHAGLSPARSCYDVVFYDLHLRIDLQKKYISGSNFIYFQAKHEFFEIEVDLFNNLQVDSILFQGSRLFFSRDSNHLLIRFSSLIAAKTMSTIAIYYQGNPVIAALPPWKGGFVWDEDSLHRPFAGVACEETGASCWWPCKDDLSDEPDSMRTCFEVDSSLYCVSNGTQGKTAYLGNGYTSYEWLVHYPINTYNVTFNIGNYVHFDDYFASENEDSLALDYYVLDYNLAKAKQHFQQVKKMLACYTEKFGPYPFIKDGYALVEAPYWGMEHQGAIAYGNHYKNDVADFDFIIIHESAHEWWGNSLSAEDRGDMWIHEAFATYAESLLLECVYNYKTALAYLKMQQAKIQNKQAIAGPMGVNYIHEDTDMYYKGTWMLHTLRNVVNDDVLWFSMIRGLASEFKRSPVNSGKLTGYFNQRTGKDLSAFFSQYLTQVSIPELEYFFTGRGRKTRLHFRWNAGSDSFSMPVAICYDAQEKRIVPSPQWQEVDLNIQDQKSFHLSDDLFLVRGRKIK